MVTQSPGRPVHLSKPGREGWCDSDRAFFESLINLVENIRHRTAALKYRCWADDDYEYMDITLPDGADLMLAGSQVGNHLRVRSIRDDG